MTLTNENQLDTLSTPTKNPNSPSTSQQTLTNELPTSNNCKPDATDGEALSMNQQVETEKPVTPAEKITNNKTIDNSGSSKQTIPPEIKEDKLAANKRNETQRSNTQGV